MVKTKELNLIMDAQSDYYNIDKFNENFQLLEDSISTHKCLKNNQAFLDAYNAETGARDLRKIMPELRPGTYYLPDYQSYNDSVRHLVVPDCTQTVDGTPASVSGTIGILIQWEYSKNTNTETSRYGTLTITGIRDNQIGSAEATLLTFECNIYTPNKDTVVGYTKWERKNSPDLSEFLTENIDEYLAKDYVEFTSMGSITSYVQSTITTLTNSTTKNVKNVRVKTTSCGVPFDTGYYVFSFFGRGGTEGYCVASGTAGTFVLRLKGGVFDSAWGKYHEEGTAYGLTNNTTYSSSISLNSGVMLYGQTKMKDNSTAKYLAYISAFDNFASGRYLVEITRIDVNNMIFKVTSYDNTTGGKIYLASCTSGTFKGWIKMRLHGEAEVVKRYTASSDVQLLNIIQSEFNNMANYSTKTITVAPTAALTTLGSSEYFITIYRTSSSHGSLSAISYNTPSDTSNGQMLLRYYNGSTWSDWQRTGGGIRKVQYGQVNFPTSPNVNITTPQIQNVPLSGFTDSTKMFAIVDGLFVSNGGDSAVNIKPILSGLDVNSISIYAPTYLYSYPVAFQVIEFY